MLVYPGPRVGFAAVAVALILGGVTYASQLRLSLRSEAGRWLLGQRQRVGTEGLPLALLAEAMRFAEQGDHYVAIVVADSAVRVLDARAPAPPASTLLAAWDSLAETIAAVVSAPMTRPRRTRWQSSTLPAALIAERTGRTGERSGQANS